MTARTPNWQEVYVQEETNYMHVYLAKDTHWKHGVRSTVTQRKLNYIARKNQPIGLLCETAH
jgi:predicted GNAT family acetyltransferase